jgi:hypothetical protein
MGGVEMKDDKFATGIAWLLDRLRIIGMSGLALRLTSVGRTVIWSN